MKKIQKKFRAARRKVRVSGIKVLQSGCGLLRTLHFFVFGLVAFLVLWGGSYYYSQYIEKVPGGVSFHGVPFSGLNRVQARNFLGQLVTEWGKRPIELNITKNGLPLQSKVFLEQEIGLQYDQNVLLSQIFDGSFFQADVLLNHSAAHEPQFVAQLDRRSWRNALQWIRSHEQPVKNASLDFDAESRQWILSDHQEGLSFLKTDESFLKDHLLAMASTGFPESLEIVMERVEPSLRTEDVQPLYEKVQLLLQKKYEWKVDGEVVGFALADNPEVIRVDIERRVVEIDQEYLQAFLSEWAKKFNRSAGTVVAQEPVLQEKGYLKSIYEGEFVSGRILDEEKLLRQILSAEVSDDILELPFEITSPDVELTGEGKLSLLSQGRSSYALAHGEDREFNVRFGLSKYDGVVIPQGAEFNFNQILGWVTFEAGWKPALAIFGGGGVKPVPGGGLCQVSTTMYRAVINSGLPVTARKPHSLDVSYYQQYGYGIDSTVYPPEDINLKFVNDTPGPILIHTFLDEVNKEVFIDFYGVDDGREVEIKQVVNREVKLPSQVSYTSDIPTGLQEVLQNGRTGRYIEWEWTIKKADGKVEKRSIETLYPAAARVVRVGTGG